MTNQTEKWHQYTVRRRVVTVYDYVVEVREDATQPSPERKARAKARRMAREAFNQPNHPAAIKSVVSVSEKVRHEGTNTRLSPEGWAAREGK